MVGAGSMEESGAEGRKYQPKRSEAQDGHHRCIRGPRHVVWLGTTMRSVPTATPKVDEDQLQPRFHPLHGMRCKRRVPWTFNLVSVVSDALQR